MNADTVFGAAYTTLATPQVFSPHGPGFALSEGQSPKLFLQPFVCVALGTDACAALGTAVDAYVASDRSMPARDALRQRLREALVAVASRESMVRPLLDQAREAADDLASAVQKIAAAKGAK